MTGRTSTVPPIRADGMRARERDYWILGRPRTAAAPRWNIVRDVLHWRD